MVTTTQRLLPNGLDVTAGQHRSCAERLRPYRVDRRCVYRVSKTDLQGGSGQPTLVRRAITL
jgi:hypothetical protein